MKKINVVGLLILFAFSSPVFSQVTDTGNNVGIGVTTPTTKLDVLGNGVLIGANSGDWSNRSNATTKAGFIFGSHFYSAYSNIAYLLFSSTNTDNTLKFGGGSSAYNAATNISFWTAANNNTPLGTQRVTIDDNGRVGIGVTAPEKMLHISAPEDDGIAINPYNAILGKTGLTTGNGNGAYTQLISWDGSTVTFGRAQLGGWVNTFAFRTSAVTRLFMNSIGNIGIGYNFTAPATLLDIQNAIPNTTPTTYNTYNHISFYKNNAPAISFQPGNGNSIFHIAHTLNNALQISNGNNPGDIPMVTFQNTGNVGIGTITPTQHLSVVGSVAIAPSGTTSDEGYNGSLMLTKPTASGQYINLVRAGSYAWSIGTVYNDNTFAIGQGTTSDAAFTAPFFTISQTGNVGIGTTNTGTHKLAVEGTIGARQVIVEAGTWSDFVFEKGYNLPSLKEVEQNIQTDGHLKDIPSSAEVAKSGISLGDMDAKLLQKIEELTLYSINQNKAIEELRQIVKSQNEQLEQLESKK